MYLRISADILGQVYEQFLGKVIRLTAGHQAKVEEKPEVRKAGGVYYTPTYIVDYIVKNTVGKLLEGLTPKTGSRNSRCSTRRAGRGRSCWGHTSTCWTGMPTGMHRMNLKSGQRETTRLCTRPWATNGN